MYAVAVFAEPCDACSTTVKWTLCVGSERSLLLFAATVVRWGSKPFTRSLTSNMSFRKLDVWGPFNGSRFSSRLRFAFEV